MLKFENHYFRILANYSSSCDDGRLGLQVWYSSEVYTERIKTEGKKKEFRFLCFFYKTMNVSKIIV